MNRSEGWLILRGLFGIVFGVLAFIWPITALVAVTVLFAVYVFVGGAMSLAAAYDQYSTHHRWVLLLVQGAVGILAGVAALVYPGIALFSLIVLMAVWALISGVLEIALAFNARDNLGHPVWLSLAGCVSILFGASLLAWPLNGLSFVVAFIGAYSFINGAMLMIWGFRHQAPSSRGPLHGAFGI